jgi:hypothetical protein
LGCVQIYDGWGIYIHYHTSGSKKRLFAWHEAEFIPEAG